MSATAPRRGRLSVLVALLCLSLAGGTVGAAETAGTVGAPETAGTVGTPETAAVDSVPDPDPTAATESGVPAAVSTGDLTENVSVWDRASLPFRIDDADAATTIPTGAVTVAYAPENTGQIDARRTATAVYRPGTANASFESVTGAGTSEFAGENAQLVVARVNSSASDSLRPTLGSPDALGSLVDPETDRFDATYAVADAGTVDSEGRLDTAVSFERPGHYVAFLATGGNFSAVDGDLSVGGSGTVVGVDTAVVERERAAVTDSPTGVEPGTNASVTVTPETNGTNVSVLLYHESTWVNSLTSVTVADRVSSPSDSPNLTIGHSIAEINGRTAVDEPVAIAGTTYGDGRLSRVTASELVDLLATRTGAASGGPDTAVIGDGTRLDASVVAERNVSGATTVEVPTRGNWTEGSYRWVVTTGGDRTAALRTATGTLRVAADSGGGFDARDRPELENAAFGSSVSLTPSSVVVTLAGTTPGRPVRLTVPVSDSELADEGFAVTGLTANFTRDVAGDLSVSTPDEAAVPPVSPDPPLGFVVINHSMPNERVSNASYSFVVSERRLDEAGIDPDAVALFRFEADGWNELPTRLVDETVRGFHFVSDSPGLSVYVAAESGSARPRFELDATSLNRSAVLANESVAVNATVVNRGTGPGVFNASLRLDNRSVETRTVGVPAGERRTLRFAHRFGATAGEYDVRLGNATVGTVTVSVPDPEPEPTESTAEANDTAPPADGEAGDTAAADATDDPLPTDDPPATEEPAGTGLDTGEVAALVVLGLVAGAGVVFYRRYGGA